MVKVFISHSSSDRWVAKRIADDLAQRGIESFLDEKDMETGDSIDDSIQKHLVDCDELLMLLSPASLASHWVMMEIGGARALNKRLVPILLHVGANELPGPLTKGLARDLNDIERYYSEAGTRSRTSAKARQDATRSERKAVASEASKPSRRRDFSAGDRVRLPITAPEHTYARTGWDVGWVPRMDQFLGSVATVTGADREEGTVSVDIDEGHWIWLMDWLAPLSDADGVTH